MEQMTSNFHHNLISMRKTFPEILVKIRRDDVMLRHMTSLRKWRHLENDVTWRHHVGFLPKFQEMFFSLILSYGANLKLFAPFKVKLLHFFVFSALIWIYIEKYYPFPTKPPYLHIYTPSAPQNHTKCVKLN